MPVTSELAFEIIVCLVFVGLRLQYRTVVVQPHPRVIVETLEPRSLNNAVLAPDLEPIAVKLAAVGQIRKPDQPVNFLAFNDLIAARPKLAELELTQGPFLHLWRHLIKCGENGPESLGNRIRGQCL